MRLIPIKYHNKGYPNDIVPLLSEIAGNLDSKQISVHSPYSLHTEYSYMKRNLNSNLLAGLDELKNAHSNGIPLLWKNEIWSYEYAVFIKRLLGDSIPPEVIEIHPPFKDYCENFNVFWQRYRVFYDLMLQDYPNVKIVIENRCGTMYTGSSFLLSTCKDIIEFCGFLKTKEKGLGLVIDYPQLFSAEKIKMDCVKLDKILQFNMDLKEYTEKVLSIHLWGKRKSEGSKRWSSHAGNLDTFFSNDQDKKRCFLESLKTVFDDNMKRYFVPEVNTSEEDLKSIVNDLIETGITFVAPK